MSLDDVLKVEAEPNVRRGGEFPMTVLRRGGGDVTVDLVGEVVVGGDVRSVSTSSSGRGKAWYVVRERVGVRVIVELDGEGGDHLDFGEGEVRRGFDGGEVLLALVGRPLNEHIIFPSDFRLRDGGVGLADDELEVVVLWQHRQTDAELLSVRVHERKLSRLSRHIPVLPDAVVGVPGVGAAVEDVVEDSVFGTGVVGVEGELFGDRAVADACGDEVDVAFPGLHFEVELVLHCAHFRELCSHFSTH